MGAKSTGASEFRRSVADCEAVAEFELNSNVSRLRGSGDTTAMASLEVSGRGSMVGNDEATAEPRSGIRKSAAPTRGIQKVRSIVTEPFRGRYP